MQGLTYRESIYENVVLEEVFVEGHVLNLHIENESNISPPDIRGEHIRHELSQTEHVQVHYQGVKDKRTDECLLWSNRV